MMEGPEILFVSLVVGVILAVCTVVGFGVYTSHVQDMECIKRGGAVCSPRR